MLPQDIAQPLFGAFTVAMPYACSKNEGFGVREGHRRPA